jgi:large conductance mechanosensitive channel
MFKEFKEFAFKGSAIDLAVGIVIGAAFGAIVKAFVDNLINPVVGVFVGKTDLANFYVAIPPGNYATVKAAQDAGAAVITYGAFLTAVLNFFIVASVLFLVVKAVNRFRAKEEATEKECPYCLTLVPCKAVRCPACTSDISAS